MEPGQTSDTESETENVFLETKGVPIDRPQMCGIEAAVAAVLKALDDPCSVKRLRAVQIGEDFAQQRDFAAALCQYGLHAIEY
jgi:hypothetical protein